MLVALSAWAVADELGDALLPGLSSAIPFRGIAHDIAFAAAAGLLIGRGLRGERGWTLIGVGALCWAAGDVYWWGALSSLGSPPVPSWADAGYLLFYPLAFAGILSLVRERASGAPRTLVADALAAALAAGALSAAVVVQPVLATAKGGGIAVATNLAYPLGDLLLLGLIVGATAFGNWRLTRTWMLLGAAVVVFWIADSFYLVTVATGTYQQNAWYNALWYWSPILVAWAAWLPRRDSVQAGERTTGARGIVLPLAFALGALGDSRAVELRLGGRARDRARDKLAAGDHVAPRADLAGELAPACSKPQRGDDRCAHGPSKPARARRRPRAADSASQRRAPVHARDVRPRRLQALQRQLRSPRGRRAAAASRTYARVAP